LAIKIQKAERYRSFRLSFRRNRPPEAQVAARGVDLINLGIGDPDTPTPSHIVARLGKRREPANHRYPTTRASASGGAAAWMQAARRRGRSGHRGRLVIGSKEGIANMAVAFSIRATCPRPDPGYPVYHIARASTAARRTRPLRRENAFSPTRSDSGRCRPRAKLFWLNYRTTRRRRGTRTFFADAIRFAERHGSSSATTRLCEIFFGERPPSIWSAGGREVAIEFTRSRRRST